MPLFKFDELIDNPPAKQPSIIGDMLLPECGSLFIVAETGVGKSAIGLDMAMCLALGKPLWNAYRNKSGEKGKPFFPVHRCCRVLYLDTELGPVGCHERCAKLRERYTQGMTIGDSFQILSGDFARVMLQNMEHGEKCLDNLNKLIEDSKPDVVFFDPLSQFHMVDENTNEMNAILGNLKVLQHRHKFAAVILHHESDKEFIHNGAPIRKPASTARARGHSSIAAWTDTMLLINTEKRSAEKCYIAELNWTKIRHSRKLRGSFLLMDINRMYFEWVCTDNAPNAIGKKRDALDAYRLKHYGSESDDDLGEL